MENKGNDIKERQNEPEFIQLLKAKSVAYDTADFWQNVDIAIVVMGMLIPFVKFFFPDFKEFAYILLGWGFVSFGISFIWDNRRKSNAKTGAKIQQEFDNKLFKLGLDVELIADDTAKLSKKYKKDVTKLNDWYSSMLTPEVNQNTAVLLCQRTNLLWSKGLREKLIMSFVWVGVIYYAIILLVGCITSMMLLDFLMVFVAPSLSMIKFIVKSYDKQTEIVNLIDKQLTKADDLLKQYINHGIEPEKNELISIQNGILELRQKPEVLPYHLYKFYRKYNEEVTDDSVQLYVKQILNKQNSK